MRWRPVEARANLIAASIASDPEFPKYTMSSQGIRLTSASARMPGSSEQSSWIRFGKVSDGSAHVSTYDGAFFEGGGIEKLKKVVNGSLPAIDLAGKRIGAPIARPWKVIGIGLNYADHAKESGMAIPPEPVMFTKASN